MSRFLDYNMATSDEESPCKLSHGLLGEIVTMVLYTSFIILGSSGNTFVILSINRTPALRIVCGIFIANLPIADLMVTAVVMPLFVYLHIQGYWISAFSLLHFFCLDNSMHFSLPLPRC